MFFLFTVLFTFWSHWVFVCICCLFAVRSVKLSRRMWSLTISNGHWALSVSSYCKSIMYKFVSLVLHYCVLCILEALVLLLVSCIRKFSKFENSKIHPFSFSDILLHWKHRDHSFISAGVRGVNICPIKVLVDWNPLDGHCTVLLELEKNREN